MSNRQKTPIDDEPNAFKTLLLIVALISIGIIVSVLITRTTDFKVVPDNIPAVNEPVKIPLKSPVPIDIDREIANGADQQARERVALDVLSKRYPWPQYSLDSTPYQSDDWPRIEKAIRKERQHLLKLKSPEWRAAFNGWLDYYSNRLKENKAEAASEKQQRTIVQRDPIH